MAITLYYLMASSPVRAVILTMRTLGIPYELKKLNVLEGDQLSKEFFKINPQHTIPTIQDDDGFVIWESPAINAYLVNKYAPNDELYPKEPKARAIVDQRLHFNTGVLYPPIRKVSIEAFIKKSTKKMTDALIAPIEEAYGFTEKFLKGKQYIAGNTVTIADFSIITSLGNTAFLLRLFYTLMSAHCRGVIFTLLALEVQFEKYIIDPKAEKDPFLLHVNPNHTVPTWEDDDVTLWDHHYMHVYLAKTFDVKDQFCPYDVTKRRYLEDRRDFNKKVVTPFYDKLVREIVDQRSLKSISAENMTTFIQIYDMVESYLDKRKYICSDVQTIADFQFLPILTDLNIFVPIQKEKYPRLTRYLKTCETTFFNYTQYNEAGLEDFKQSVKDAGFVIPGS